MKQREIKTKSYTVIRLIEEKYHVLATSKEEASHRTEDPYSVTVKKETIILIR